MVIRSKRAASTACLRTTTGLLVLLLAALSTRKSTALSLFRDESNRRPNFAEPHDTHGAVVVARRQVVSSILATAAFTTTGIEVFASSPSFAIANAADAAAATSGNQPPLSDSFNVDQYLKTGMVQNPMGVSGQAGKSKPETGVLLRDGSEVSRDSRTGDVLAEILLRASSNEKIPVLASFVSPWPLASGSVFDVECRNPKTGDGSFLAVSSTLPAGTQSIQDLPDSFFVNQLIGPTGRFSSYGTPTDIKFKSVNTGTASTTGDAIYRTIDLSFSTLSQSTQTEIPRRARIVATIPVGTQQAVMLVGSASANRWSKGSQDTIAQVANSFRAIPAPNTSLRLRFKDRRNP